MFRTAAVVVFAMLLPTVLAAAEEEAPVEPALTDSPVNLFWEIEGRRNDELVYVRKVGHEPVLEFNSKAFRGLVVTIDMETDSTRLKLQNRAGEIDLKLAPAKKYRLVLDGDPDKPTLKLGSQELTLQAPEWGRIINDERTTSFRLMLRGATEAKVTLDVRRGEIHLRKPGSDDEKK